MPTSHGFDLIRGLPLDEVSKRGVRWILTRDLARYLRSHPRWSDIDLPLNRKTIQKFRIALDLRYPDQRETWWQKHLAELGRLSTREFAEKHNLSELTVRHKRRAYLGVSEVQRPNGWWQEPAVLEILLRGATLEASEALQLSVTSVRSYRSKARQMFPKIATRCNPVDTALLKRYQAQRGKHPTPEFYGIHRKQYTTRAGAWSVRVVRRGQIVANKHFSDRKHGGTALAFEKASSYRDEVLKAHPPMTKQEFNQIIRGNNTSGVAGVHLRKVGRHQSFVVHTQLPSGVLLRDSFSVKALGRERAYRSALAERQRQLQLVEGYFVHNDSAILPPEDEA